jgi:hypothetical protein
MRNTDEDDPYPEHLEISKSPLYHFVTSVSTSFQPYNPQTQRFYFIILLLNINIKIIIPHVSQEST